MDIDGISSAIKPVATSGKARAEKAAQMFEASFLSEMLSHTGLGRMPDTFGGGEGESQFSSLLVAEYARIITENGGIGLQESVVQAILGKGPANESQ